MVQSDTKEINMKISKEKLKQIVTEELKKVTQTNKDPTISEANTQMPGQEPLRQPGQVPVDQTHFPPKKASVDTGFQDTQQVSGQSAMNDVGRAKLKIVAKELNILLGKIMAELK
jgi:hypothetical protein